VQRILVALAIINTACLLTAAVLGTWVEPRVQLAAHWEGQAITEKQAAELNRPFFRHFVAGICAGVTTLLTHSIVMTYFIGTGRWVKEAVEKWALDAVYERRTRKLKARSFPFAFFSMVLVIATTILGGATDTGMVPGWTHLTAALVTILFNLISYYFEYAAVSDNVRLLDEVVAAARRSAQPGRT